MSTNRNSRWMRWVTENSADAGQPMPWQRGKRPTARRRA